jgi:hypothetical protein
MTKIVYFVTYKHMTPQQLKKAQKRLDNLYSNLYMEVGSSTMDMVNEIVELELQIEAECNK